MTGGDTHEARCGCGGLRVTTVGDPDLVVACSCIACQRRTGSPFGVGAYFRKETVSAEGEAGVYTRVADSGLTVSLNFCPSCGTNVYWFAELRPDHYGVAAGCFASPASSNPPAWSGTRAGIPGSNFPTACPCSTRARHRLRPSRPRQVRGAVDPTLRPN